LGRYLQIKQQVPELQPTSLNGSIEEPKAEVKKKETKKQSPRRSRRKSKLHKWDGFDA